MRVLLDENVPKRLKRLFDPGFEVMTVLERGWFRQTIKLVIPPHREGFLIALLFARLTEERL